MNQAPTEEKPNAYLRKIKTVQFIYIIEKVGLMNQAPTEEKPNIYIRKIKTVQFIYIIEKVGLMNQAPTEEKPNTYIRNIENGARPHFPPFPDLNAGNGGL